MDSDTIGIGNRETKKGRDLNMRNIFLVDARIVDANGALANVTGYPKVFDSKHYGDDVDKAKRRAEGDMSEAWGAMCKIDTRQVQVVTLNDMFGNLIEKKSMGDFPENQPAPDPEATSGAE